MLSAIFINRLKMSHCYLARMSMCVAYLLTLVMRLILSIIFILIDKLHKLDIPPIVINWIP